MSKLFKRRAWARLSPQADALGLAAVVAASAVGAAADTRTGWLLRVGTHQ